jgi:hypothetical protein
MLLITALLIPICLLNVERTWIEQEDEMLLKCGCLMQIAMMANSSPLSKKHGINIIWEMS